MIEKTFYKTKDYCKVKFSVNNETAETIELFGINNNWEDAVVLKKKKDGTFATEINLPKETTHQFKYLVDQQDWLTDETADNTVTNEFGTDNSVLVL